MKEVHSGRLGVLGGMGPEATKLFYERLIVRTPAKRDQEHLPALILSDTQMPDRTAAILGGDAEEVYQRLLSDARLLEGCGCSCIAIPCNTSHYFADRLQEALSAPILHMPRLTVERLKVQGCSRAALLATTGTVQTGVYLRECRKAGIALWTPPEELQRQVMWLIYDAIKGGISTDGSEFAAIDAAVRSSGCDCAILGCTELSVYRVRHAIPAFYVDAMEVLCEACIDYFEKNGL